MAVEVGEVGAAFFLEDRASGPLNRIGEAFDRVQGMLDRAAAGAEAFSRVRFAGVTQSLGAMIDRLDVALAAMDRLSSHSFVAAERSIGALSDQMLDLGAAADLMQGSFTTAMSRITGETARATAEMRSFTAAAEAAAAAGRGIGGGGPGGGGGGPLPPGGGGRRGGGGGHGGGGISAGGIYHYGGFSALMFNPLAMAGGLAGYYALDEAAKYDLAIRTTIQGLGADPSSPEGQAMRPIIEDTITKSTVGTIFDKREVAETGVGFASIYGSAMPRDHPDQALSPTEKARRISGIERTVMQFAEVEKRMGKGSLEENVEAGVFMAHLTRQYSPETLGPTLDRLLAISRMTGKTPMEVERTMKYSVTTGALGGVDPNDILTATGFLMQSGITGTTAGTGLAQMIQSIYEGAGPEKKGVAHRARDEDRDRADLMRALHGTISLEKPEHRGVKINERREGLIEMGIIDRSGKPMAGMADASGNLKLWPIIEALSKFADDPRHDKLALAHLETKVFGTRGARAEEPFMGREQLQLLHQYREGEALFMKNLGVDETQKQQAQSPMQEFQQTLARTKDLMLEIVYPGLSDLGHAAKELADVLQSVTGYMHAHPLLGKIVTDAASGAVGGAIVGSVVPGLGTGAGALIGGAAGALGALIHNAPPYGSGGEMDLGMNPFTGVGSMHVAPSRPPNANPYYQPRAIPQSFHTGGGGAQVTIHNINFGAGTPRDHVDQFIGELSRRLGSASLHDLGVGMGHTQSGFSVGRTVSV